MADFEPFTLDQRGCMYLPHVSGIRVGQKLLVANSDPTVLLRSGSEKTHSTSTR